MPIKIYMKVQFLFAFRWWAFGGYRETKDYREIPSY